MLYTWLLVVGLLGGAAYAEDDCCSSEDKAEVSFMWHQLWHTSHSERKVAIMKAVFDDLITKHPEVKEILKAQHVDDMDSPIFRAYVIRVTHGFDNIINLIDEPTILEEQIHFMADTFGARVGVKKSYFEAVLDSFESVFPKVSTCFNVSAWSRCLRRLVHSLASKVKD